MEVTVKAFLPTPDGVTEVRRLALTLKQDGTMFQVLSTNLIAAFPDLKNRDICIAWQDSDNDHIWMSSNAELKDALNQTSTGVLKLYITDIGPSEGNVEIKDPERDQVKHDWEMPQRRGRARWGRGHFLGPFPQQLHGQPLFSSPRLTADNSEEGAMMAERRGLKRDLRKSVPVSHRRWAKLYIHNWRCQNLANATTASSDSEREFGARTLTTKAGGVPEAYVVWLDVVLCKFHQRWGKSGEADKCQEGDNDAGSMATLRLSVPVEFRKWAWWFLRKRYGKRCSPRFRRSGNSETRLGPGRGQGHRQGEHGSGSKRKLAVEKLGALAKAVPRPVRLWAKHVIVTWQLERHVALVMPQVSLSAEETDVPDGVLQGPGMPGGTVQEPGNPDTKVQLPGVPDALLQGQGVPEDYGKWLLMFLPKWHVRHGLLDKSKGERNKGDLAQFKSTVPQVFRDWVKCYLNKHLNKHLQSGVTNTEVTDKHQRWLQAFKTKWLRQKEATLTWASSSEGEVTTSDNAALTSDTDTDMEITSSLKGIGLESNKQKTVQFAEDSDSNTAKILKKKPGRGFRQMAKYELSAWDGVSTVYEADDAEIPPHVYRWLCRVMVKMEERKIRQMKKAGKRETRLARKELKAISDAQKQN